MSTEAQELHRIISAERADMLDAYRSRRKRGRFRPRRSEEGPLSGRRMARVEPRAVPGRAAGRAAASVVRVLAGDVLEDVAGPMSNQPARAKGNEEDVA